MVEMKAIEVTPEILDAANFLQVELGGLMEVEFSLDYAIFIVREIEQLLHQTP